MGESFKHYSQALIGYEDEIMPDPSNGMDALNDPSLLDMQTAY